MKKQLVVFDFDGTISNRDSMLEFTKYHKGNLRFFWGMIFLSPILIAYKLGIIPNWRAKEFYLRHFFKGEELQVFQKSCDQFGLQRIPTFVRKKALQSLQEHRSKNNEIVVVSSSAENWLSAWCKQQQIDLIGTHLEVVKDRLNGNLSGPNCYGSEKVIRLKEKYNLDSYDEILVYGDSKGDYQLFEISTSHFFKPFRN